MNENEMHLWFSDAIMSDDLEKKREGEKVMKVSVSYSILLLFSKNIY